jgi:hypothetical protein
VLTLLSVFGCPDVLQCPGKVAANGLQLGEVADLEAQMFNLAQMFIRIPNVQFSTEPAILPNCC